MARKAQQPSAEQIKRMADRAEGLRPDAPETVMGRPPKYQPSFAGQAEKLAKLGATNVELADFFEVSVRTVERWCVEHEEFSRSVKSGKDAADDRVERSLYQRAVGYTHDAVKIMLNAGEVVRVEYRQHLPPETTACIFWLKNRRKDAWRDKHDIEHSSADQFAQMSDQELEQYIKKEAAALLERPATGLGAPRQRNSRAH